MIKLEDIARLAGVSKATVSLVLNDKPGVSQKKRAEILQLVKENDYQPLRQSRKKEREAYRYTVRLLACNDINRFTYNFQKLPHFNELINDFLVLSTDFHIHLTVNSISISHLKEDLMTLESQQASDAIILLGTDLPESILIALKELHHHIIVIDTCFDHLNSNFISINNYQGAFLATEHLIQNGHKDIGYAMAKYRIQNFQERYQGFEGAMKKYNLDSKQFQRLRFPANSIGTYPDKIPSSTLPTAFFCENDSIAISLIRSLQAAGIRVPEDVSVIGFDNISESVIITPELSTIDINRQFMVTKALEKAVSIIKNGEINQTQTRINTRLVVRQSVKKLETHS
ncbi:LacI family DNA-binding transcriptional regulator [Streptococcus ovuberis]|uniref:LacI family transcriptional regulator n=1 Tax=Streptococcus ovuberis TaxID=1936207 RepID=A0A7X6S1B3_9STRE|nr:LacI family DNA-binding transcriptional regulator [Streptococcus ovuberis]NKZ20195.1 LacI family transcriptional regulator [Streptococcus ovuberis]